jgi:Na+-driven multidrug efflux pump
VALVVRTVTLRAALLVTTYAAAGLGATAMATHQLASTIWVFLAFTLDAIAIAAQAITGRYLGAGDVATTRSVTNRMVRWGLLSGVVTGLGLALASPLLGPLFTRDGAVHAQLWPVLVVAALFQPVAGVVFVLDGVLIGAGDGRYLAWASAASVAAFLPAAWAVLALDLSQRAGLVALWLAIGVWTFARLVTLAVRERGSRWLVTGATR